VPIVLEGAPVVVDDRGLVVGGTLEDKDPFRVVELCGVPLVRFRFLITSVLRDWGRTTPCSFCVKGSGDEFPTKNPNTEQSSHRIGRKRYIRVALPGLSSKAGCWLFGNCDIR